MSIPMRTGVFGAAAALVILAAGTAAGTIYVVSPDGLGDYPTIQAAVLAATDGDVIELTDGTFTGDGNRDIQVPARPIAIWSQSGDYMECIIDCGGSAREEHRGFRFGPEVGTGDATLTGVGIINGYTSANGGGILIEEANPTISNCAVAFCTADGGLTRGGGICLTDGAAPSVSYCLVSGNTAGYGGGIAIDSSTGMFHTCDITDNLGTSVAGGVYIDPSGEVWFDQCTVVSNSAPRAGGVQMAGGSTHLVSCSVSRNDATSGYAGGIWLQGGFVNNCTIVENSATAAGGGVYCQDGAGVVVSCIIAFTEDGHGVAGYQTDVPYLECCDVYGNVEGNYDSVVGDQTGLNDNFSLDPELCGIEIADYRLFDTSPCLQVNSPCDWLVGAFDQGCDSPVEDMSWGRVKALYR